MGLSSNPDFSDILDGQIVAASVSVNATASEAKVGGSRLSKRQVVRIFNNSSTTIYWGPSGVTSSIGEPIYFQQWVNIPAGENLPIFLITASGTASDVRIQEWS